MKHSHRITTRISRIWVITLVAVLPVLLMLAFPGCSGKKNQTNDSARPYVVVAIEGDVDSFNPLFAEDANAGEVNDLLYPGLVLSHFDTAKGTLDNSPLIACAWEVSADGKDITFHLRTDARWSDGTALTAKDVQYSYELYADTAVASVRQSAVEGLRRGPKGVFDIKSAVEVVNDSTVVFHFDHPYPGEMFDAGLPILPEHLFGKVARHELRGDSLNHHPISSGPFLLKEWKPLEQVTLGVNPTSVLPAPAKISSLVLRVIPEYQSRLAQFKSGAVDVFPLIEAEDAAKLLKEDPNASIVPIGERFYDAINWNNIDGNAFAQSNGKQVKPHPLFGSPAVRRALTMAINRKEIVETFLAPYGRESFGPVSPLFRWAYNDTINPLPFQSTEASAMLAKEGWKDSDGDGILDKGGRPFSFTLRVASGNQLRMNIAAVVQRQLKAIKIDMKIEQIERSAFWDDVMARKFDACIAGFTVPLQMQLDEMWGSDLEKSHFNLTGFRNARVDQILAGARKVAHDSDHASAWKEFQTILQREQPCTFLYWMNDLVAVNKRVHGTQIGLLGTLYHAGDWSLEGAK